MQLVVSIGEPHERGSAGDRLPCLPDSTAPGLVETHGLRVCVRRWGVPATSDCQIYSSGDAFIVFFGYLVEPLVEQYEPIAEWLAMRMGSASTTAEVGRIVREFNGSFGFVYSGQHGVFAVSDRLASRPIWYQSGGDAVHFSANPLTLARTLGAGDIDLGPFTSFLVYGDPGDPRRCAIEGIRSLGPGVVVHVARGGAVTQEKWFEFRHRPDESRKEDEWADEIAGRLRTAAARIAPFSSDATLFLSGGIDSRLVGAALRAGGCRFNSITLADSPNIETRVAARAARSLSCPNKLMMRDRHWYLRAMPRSVFLSGGTYDFAHAHFFQALGGFNAPAVGAPVLLGDFAEAFSKLLHSIGPEEASPCSPSEFFARYEDIRMPHYRPADCDRTLRLLQPAVREEARGRLRELVMARYEECLAVSNDPRVVYDYFLRWYSAGAVATWHMFNDLRAAVPFRNIMIDRDVHDLVQRMPSRMRSGRNLAVRAMRRLHPASAAVPNSNTLVPAYWPRPIHAAAAKLRPIVGKIKRRFVENSYKTTAAWPHYPLFYLQDEAWRAVLTSTLGNADLFDADLFDRDEVGRAVAEFLAGDQTRHHDVERLMHYGTMTAQLRS